MPVFLTARPPIALARISDAATRNALSSEIIEELERLVEKLEADGAIRAVVLTGDSGSFAAGAKIGELSALTVGTALPFSLRCQRLFQRIYSGTRLFVAAIDGFCMGGGLDLALSCHLRYATPRSVFAHPGPRLGIITGWGGTQTLPRLVGRHRALEMLLTGSTIDASVAAKLGLVDQVCDDPVREALRTIESAALQETLNAGPAVRRQPRNGV